MMEDISRTVLILSNLALSSLLATALAIGAAHASQPTLEGSALCRACMDSRIARIAKPDTPAQILEAAMPVANRAI